MTSTANLDIHMPLLAFVGLMLEHGMSVSERTWEKIETIDAGERLDEEIARATQWLNEQNKSQAVGPMVREVCQKQEVAVSDTHWVRLVGLPMAGPIQHMGLLARHLAAQKMGTLGESPRLPTDAQWAWLPRAFDPVDVDKWLTAPRRWISETVLAGCGQREKLAESLRLLGMGLAMAEGSSEMGETDGVRLLIGVMISKETAWLAPDPTQPGHLLHLGVNLHAMADELARELHAHGLPTDDESVQDHFAGRYGQSLDEAAQHTSEAIDREMTHLNSMLANTQGQGVTFEPIYPLAEALGRCFLLGLNRAINQEMDRRHVTVPLDFSEVHLALSNEAGQGWATGVTGTGQVWGPYHLQGMALWEDQVPDMAREVFEDHMQPGGEATLVFHDHAGDLPRGGHRLH